MSRYENFKLVLYVTAQTVKRASVSSLQQQIDFFSRYLTLDKVYLEPFRGETEATSDQVTRCKQLFEQNGITVAGGITTTTPTLEGADKQRLYSTYCYTEVPMRARIKRQSAFLAAHFDEFIIDDFFFTNCACESCIAARDQYNECSGIADGSWQAFRMDLMQSVSRELVLQPAKAVNPDCKVTIKFPNWMESYQETGYCPGQQADMFPMIYTGTETRDARHTDQHLPRYLSYSLMRYMEEVAPGRNGGGWFDPYDMMRMDEYLEQAYLTVFAKPKEVMMFCMESLVDTPVIPPLGFMLEKLDQMIGLTGAPLGVPTYIPHDARGEDNLQDFLGMAGFPLTTTPNFPSDAPVIMLTLSSAYDIDIMTKLESFVRGGGKAIVTSGFVGATMERGFKRLSSIRLRDRHVRGNAYMSERLTCEMLDYVYESGQKDISFAAFDYANNAARSLVKLTQDEENYPIFLSDTYGRGQILTFATPDSFSHIKHMPSSALSRMRIECPINGVYLQGEAGVSLFHYEGDMFVLYPYVTCDASPSRVRIHAKDALSLTDAITGRVIKPLYGDVFEVGVNPGRITLYKIQR